MIRIFACVALLGALSACSYAVEQISPEPEPAITAYAEKVPGKWALLIEADRAIIHPEAQSARCSQFDYQGDLSNAFSRTAAATFEKVADDVRVSDHALSRAELASGSYSGVIVLRVTGVHSKVRVDDLIGGQAIADAGFDGTILVTHDTDRLIDDSQSARGHAERAAGLACDGAADALAAADDQALKDVVRRLAEQFANSHAVRAAAVHGLTP